MSPWNLTETKMNNSTSEDPFFRNKIIYTTYWILGLFMMLGNGLIITVVAKNKHLRKKEFLIPAGLAVGDFIFGLGNFSAASDRLHLIYSGQADHQVTPWECMGKLHNICFIFGAQSLTLMTVFMTIDRFIATSNIAYYMGLETRYAVKGISIVFGFCTASLLVGVVTSHMMEQELVTEICILAWAVPIWYNNYNIGEQVAAGLVSISIYFGLLINLRRGGSVIENDQIKADYRRRQVKVTRMITVVVISGFFLHDLPMFLMLLMNHNREWVGENFGIYVPTCHALASFSSANNIVIYVMKNKEIRGAVFGMFGIRGGTGVSTVAPSGLRSISVKTVAVK